MATRPGEPKRRKTAIITGASKGIGKELAKIFAREGNDVLLVARGEGALEKLASELRQEHSIRAMSLPIDLSDKGAPDRIFEFSRSELTSVDYLVNNAGFATLGLFSEANLKTQLDMLQVNVAALVELTGLFLPGMIARGSGRILNLASMAAFAPGPLMAVYYASKAFVLSFSEALANEAKGTGVTVTVLCPGPTRTGFEQRAGIRDLRMLRQGVMDAETVALAGYRGMMEGKKVVIPGLRNRVTRFVLRVTPSGFAAGAVRRLHKDAS